MIPNRGCETSRQGQRQPQRHPVPWIERTGHSVKVSLLIVRVPAQTLRLNPGGTNPARSASLFRLSHVERPHSHTCTAICIRIPWTVWIVNRRARAHIRRRLRDGKYAGSTHDASCKSYKNSWMKFRPSKPLCPPHTWHIFYFYFSRGQSIEKYRELRAEMCLFEVKRCRGLPNWKIL